MAHPGALVPIDIQVIPNSIPNGIPNPRVAQEQAMISVVAAANAQLAQLILASPAEAQAIAAVDIEIVSAITENQATAQAIAANPAVQGVLANAALSQAIVGNPQATQVIVAQEIATPGFIAATIAAAANPAAAQAIAANPVAQEVLANAALSQAIVGNPLATQVIVAQEIATPGFIAATIAAAANPAAAQAIAEADPQVVQQILANIPLAQQIMVSQRASSVAQVILANPAAVQAAIPNPAADPAAVAQQLQGQLQAAAAQSVPGQAAQAAAPLPVQPPYVMRRPQLAPRGAPIPERLAALNDVKRNLTITSDIIQESIRNEIEFLNGHNIINIPGSGYNTMLTEVTLLRISLIIGGVFLTVNSAHFTERANLPAQLTGNDYRRRLRVLENQSEGLIDSARRRGEMTVRTDMIMKFRRDTYTESLIAEQLFYTYEKIKYGQHLDQPQHYGPYMIELRTHILNMFALGAGVAQGNAFFANFLQLINLYPASIYSNTIKLKLREIEASACLYAYYLTQGENYQSIDHEQLIRILRSFTETDNRLAALGIRTCRLDLAGLVGYSPFHYLFDRTILDMGRFAYRMTSSAKIGLATLFSSLYTLADSFDNPIAYDPQVSAQIAELLERHIYGRVLALAPDPAAAGAAAGAAANNAGAAGADNAEGGLLIMDNIIAVRQPNGKIRYDLRLGGAGMQQAPSLYDQVFAILDLHEGYKQYIANILVSSANGVNTHLRNFTNSADVENPYYTINDKFLTACKKYREKMAEREEEKTHRIELKLAKKEFNLNSTHLNSTLNRRRMKHAESKMGNTLKGRRGIPIAAHGGSRKKRVKRTRKNHKRSRRH